MNDLNERFTRFAEEAGRKYGVVCQLAQVRGARWSFVTGGTKVPASKPERFLINDGTGVIIYGMEGLSDELKAELKGEIEKGI